MTQEIVSDELLQQYASVLIECDMRKMVRELIALRAQMREAKKLLRELTEPAEVQEQTRIFNDALAFLQLLRGQQT